MTKNIFKLKNFLIGFLVLVLSLAPIQSMAIVGTQASTKRAECTSIFNNGTSNGTNYLLAAGCYSQLFDNPLNTERSKELNNKTISLKYYNTFCTQKFNQGDFNGARDCYQVAIDQSCNKSPKIEEYCGKFNNNTNVSAASARGQVLNYNNFELVNTRKVELNTCNQTYYRSRFDEAKECYQKGINNTCNTFSNNTELDALCGKFRNNYAVTQNTINNSNIFNANTGASRLNQETDALAYCTQELYYQNKYSQARDCYQKGVNNTCYGAYDYNSDLSLLCSKNRNNYAYTNDILSYCLSGYDNYNNYNRVNCRQNSNGTLEIIAGVATALVVACLFFCNTAAASNTAQSDNYRYTQ